PFAVAQRLPPLDPLQGCVVAVGCATTLAVRGWRHRAAVLLCAALTWGVAERGIVDQMQPEGVLRISFVDVGQGDAALVDFPDGSLGLIDTGPGDRHPAGRELVRALRERRRNRIDRVIITHGHPDHDGGLARLLNEFEVGELWLNGQRLAEERDGSFRALLGVARNQGVLVRFVGELCGEPHGFGGVRLEVLWPCPRYDPALDLNDNSLTVLLSYGTRRALMTGDLEAAAEAELLAGALIPSVDILKVGHHGSKTSSTLSFVARAAPTVAVISVGKHNRYGHPHPEVIARLRATGGRVLRTDTDGGVEIETDGERLRIRSWRDDVDGQP
ncbi:MAG: MBL fold metallo-hydrolase, partial [Polyangiales bacterium]